MNTLKKLQCKFIIVCIFFTNGILFAQKGNQNTTIYTINALSEAVKIYHNQDRIGYPKYMVIVVKIMKINEVKGEFVLSNIWITSNFDYDNFQPTHYIKINNEILLVKIDKHCNCNPEKYGINIINKEIKDLMLDLDIIKGPTRLTITAQESPFLVVKYKRDKVSYKYYNYLPLPRKKYWF